MRQDWVWGGVGGGGGGDGGRKRRKGVPLAAHHLFPASIRPLWKLKRSTRLCFLIPTTLKGPF